MFVTIVLVSCVVESTHNPGIDIFEKNMAKMRKIHLGK